MSYYQQRNRNRLTIGHDGNALTMLIAAILSVFVILAFIKVAYFISFGNAGAQEFESKLLEWVSLPASFTKLATRPWTILTHMLVHNPSDTGVWHIIGNLLWLWAFGFILQDLTGNRSIIPIFFYGALAGALVYMIAYNTIPPLKITRDTTIAYGASAGVMAIAIATTTLAPGYRVFTMLNGGIPIWVLTLLYLVIDLASIPGTNSGGHIAHLAGAAMGYFYIKRLNRGQELGAWMSTFWNWVTDLFNPDKPKKGTVVNSQLFYKSKIQPFKKTPHLTQQKVDEILDKIHQKGYGALSEDERELLKRASKEDM